LLVLRNWISKADSKTVTFRRDLWSGELEYWIKSDKTLVVRLELLSQSRAITVHLKLDLSISVDKGADILALHHGIGLHLLLIESRAILGAQVSVDGVALISSRVGANRDLGSGIILGVKGYCALMLLQLLFAIKWIFEVILHESVESVGSILLDLDHGSLHAAVALEA